LPFSFLLAALTTAGHTSAQETTVQVGTATLTTNNAPIHGNWNFSYSQSIYTAANITASGGYANGYITKVRYYYSSGTTTSSTNWTIYLGHTALTNFATNTSWVSSTGLTNCFSGTVTYPAAGNWIDITLATPFQWNGVDNIIIGVDENQGGFGGSIFFRYTNTGTDNRTIFYNSDPTNPDPVSPPSATSRGTWAPNIQFAFVPACSGAPAHATTTVNDAQICPAQTVNLGMSGALVQNGMSYQWQQNDGSGWVAMAGTAMTNTATNPVTMDYRVIQACANSGLTDTATSVTVTMNTNPVVTINHTDIALCDSEPANLEATGADTYLWSPTTLLTPSATSATVNVIPAATTTYTVVGTITATGCTGTATALITPVPLTRSTATFSPSENCTFGTPITLSITDVPAEITSGGTWEYRFMDADGATVVQDWSASADYTFTPSADGIYDIFYQMRSTSCINYNVDSIKKTIIVGFGADSVDITGFNCNSDGILEMMDTYGQVAIDTIYTNPLSDLATMTDFALANNASVTAGRLVLTPSATGQVGYATLTVPGFEIGANNAMRVSFNMTADTPINTFQTGGADGLCYSFGNDATPTGNGTGHNGKGTKLRLSFDAASNGTENGNAPGIYLVYGWTATNAFGPGSAQTLAYSPNTALWKIQTDVPVVLDITSDGKATVTVGGQVVFANIQLPPAYMTADVSEWKHLFSASTGGDAMRQAVSNLNIEAGSLLYGITSGGSSIAPSSWQSEKVFEDLLPGNYDLWISRDETGACLKNIGTYEILNLNPIVDLGNDTTLCEGEMITLNAGNPGATYVWSGNNVYVQTLEVTEAGSYVVNVTDSVGCLAIGTINVDYNEAPSATGIYAQGTFPMMSFSVLGAQNATTYDWNFGDGNSVQNGPASVSHMYDEDGTFTVTVTLTNDCGTETETTSITIIDYTGVGENTIEGLEVYPNPSRTTVNISIPNAEMSEYRVFSISGAEVVGSTAFNSNTKVDVSAWESGVYFLTVTNGGITTTQKVVVE